MPKKARSSRRLLLRKKIGEREKGQEKTLLIGKKPGKKPGEKAKNPARPLNFTKTVVAGIDPPPKGERRCYRDTKTPHLCLRVTPTAKTFYWEKTIRGSQKRVTIGRFPEINVEQARDVAADIAADYTKGVDVAEERRAGRSEGTFGELWKDYRENRPRRDDDAPYSTTLDNQWNRVLKRWEHKQLSEMSRSMVRRYLDRIRKRAPIYSNRLQLHGRAMFNYAAKSDEWAWDGKNPFAYRLYSEKNRKRKTRLRPDEMKAFLKGLDACSESMRLLFLFSLYTGRRIGEVKAMRWEELTLERGIWEIPMTKIGESQIAMLPMVVRGHLTKRKKKTKSEWVFPGPSRSGHLEEIKKAWTIVREVSGLQELQARDLRRTMASWAQDEGVAIAIMQSQLGHKSSQTTSDYYTIILEAVQRDAVETTVASMIEAAAT